MCMARMFVRLGGLFLLGMVLVLGTPNSTAQETTAGTAIRNAWSAFPEGAWVAFDWSERWGTNPATVEQRRTRLSGHRSIGTSTTETQRQEAGTWKRMGGGLHGAHSPEGEGLGVASEIRDPVVIGGRASTCRRTEYVNNQADGSGQRLLLWHCDGVELADRVLPQWSVSFGWQLPPDVPRAVIERRDDKGVITSVELTLDSSDDPLSIGGRAVPCFREQLVWRHRMPGQPEGRITGVTTRWLSRQIPGLVAKQVDDNQMGRVTTVEVTGFGTTTE
jgi:hypothetical protein